MPRNAVLDQESILQEANDLGRPAETPHRREPSIALERCEVGPEASPEILGPEIGEPRLLAGPGHEPIGVESARRDERTRLREQLGNRRRVDGARQVLQSNGCYRHDMPPC